MAINPTSTENEPPDFARCVDWLGWHPYAPDCEWTGERFLEAYIGIIGILQTFVGTTAPVMEFLTVDVPYTEWEAERDRGETKAVKEGLAREALEQAVARYRTDHPAYQRVFLKLSTYGRIGVEALPEKAFRVNGLETIQHAILGRQSAKP